MLQSNDRYVSGRTYPVLFKISIAQGWGIHGPHEGKEGLIPTRLVFDSSSDFKIQSVVFPKPEKIKYEYTSEAIEVFINVVWIKCRLQIQNTQTSFDAVLKGRFSYQACSTNVCRPPETVPIAIPIPIVANSEAAPP